MAETLFDLQVTASKSVVLFLGVILLLANIYHWSWDKIFGKKTKYFLLEGENKEKKLVMAANLTSGLQIALLCILKSANPFKLYF